MKQIFYFLLFGFGSFLLTVWLFSMRPEGAMRQASGRLADTWRGYKNYFIGKDGEVLRPREQDAISEGQSNAMIRAVVMGDRDVFDRVRKWTRAHLSREKTAGDHLLSWHYSRGAVLDIMPASDADMDYALALLLASRLWEDKRYASEAKEVLKDILDKLTVVFKYHRYLLPWIVDSPKTQTQLPQNLSYYSPAFFKLFYAFDHDPRWLELIDTAYTLILQGQKGFNGVQGVGLVPDWCVVDINGGLHEYSGHSTRYGWEAVRVPFHIGMDAFFYRDPRAFEILSNLARFAERELGRTGKLVGEYSYDGKSLQEGEGSLSYAAFYVALDLTASKSAPSVMAKLRGRLHTSKKGAYYDDPKQYYANSLAWLAELLYRERMHDQR